MPSLLTEDQGPAVSGIWSVVIPKLMELARHEPAFSDGFVGARLYYHEVRQRKDALNVEVTMAVANLSMMLHQAMHVMADPDDVLEDLEYLGSDFADEMALEWVVNQSAIHRRWLDEQVEDYLNGIERHKLFGRANTRATALPKVLAGLKGVPAEIDVSSSHCIRLHIKDKDAQRLMQEFRSSLSKPCWADPERTQRA